ncbi:substrate binding domain-containing protein [Pseudomonas lalucatii]|nr:substrate binding domain-containing protein [Pseudomonas lalucatii]
MSVAQSIVPLAFFANLAQFMASYPDLSVDVIITDRMVNLVEEGIDCALRSGRVPADADLVARKLTSVRWLTCAAPSYLAGRGIPARIADLGRHDCIQFVSPSTRRGCDWPFEEGGKRVAFTPRGRLRLTSWTPRSPRRSPGSGWPMSRSRWCRAPFQVASCSHS